MKQSLRVVPYGVPEVFGEGNTVPVPLLGDLAIDMGKVFRE
jgi:hypothetical protein